MNRLHAIGLEVTGEVGVQDPIQATRDALRGREIDEVILSTLPPGISRWLGQDVPSKLKGSIQVPVAVVTTPEAGDRGRLTAEAADINLIHQIFTATHAHAPRSQAESVGVRVRSDSMTWIDRRRTKP